MPDLTELERLAAKCEPMPDGLNGPEQILYQGLRNLHFAYRTKQIDREQARQEKAKLTEEFEQASRKYSCWENHIAIRNTMSHKLTEATKHGCPICRELVAIFEGNLSYANEKAGGELRA